MDYVARVCAAVCCAFAASAASAELVAITGGGALLRVSTLDASVTPIGFGFYGASSPGGLEWDEAHQYLVATGTGASPSLFAVDPVSGAAAPIGATGLPFIFEGGLQFAPDGTLFATNGTTALEARLLTIDAASGVGSAVGVISSTETDVNGLAWRSDGVLVGIDRVRGALILIDPASGAMTGTLAPIASFVGSVGGMANAGDNLAYVSLGDNSLYTCDLFTGEMSLIGIMNPLEGDAVTGLAFIPAPAAAPVLFGVLAAGWLRRRPAPGRVAQGSTVPRSASTNIAMRRAFGAIAL